MKYKTFKDFLISKHADQYHGTDDDTPFITASGERVRDGIIACPRYFPFGTKILIGDKIYDCEDRLHPDYIHRFDIWFDSRESALEFGKQVLEIKKVIIY